MILQLTQSGIPEETMNSSLSFPHANWSLPESYQEKLYTDRASGKEIKERTGPVYSAFGSPGFSMIAISLFQSKVCRFMIWDRMSLTALPVSNSFLRS